MTDDVYIVLRMWTDYWREYRNKQTITTVATYNRSEWEIAMDLMIRQFSLILKYEDYVNELEKK